LDKTTHDFNFFLHIPKAAGSTINSIINQQFNSIELFRISKIIKSEIGNKWKVLPAPEREQIAREKFTEYINQNNTMLSMVIGHMKFGWHNYLEPGTTSTYLTMLREPVDRVISLYYYTRRVSGHYINDKIKQDHMDLSDYIQSGISLQIDNGMTRIISGIGYDRGFGKCDTDMLSLAMDNLENKFSFVGISEHFDESLFILKQMFSWDTPYYLKKKRQFKKTA